MPVSQKPFWTTHADCIRSNHLNAIFTAHMRLLVFRAAISGPKHLKSPFGAYLNLPTIWTLRDYWGGGDSQRVGVGPPHGRMGFHSTFKSFLFHFFVMRISSTPKMLWALFPDHLWLSKDPILPPLSLFLLNPPHTAVYVAPSTGPRVCAVGRKGSHGAAATEPSPASRPNCWPGLVGKRMGIGLVSFDVYQNVVKIMRFV